MLSMSQCRLSLACCRSLRGRLGVQTQLTAGCQWSEPTVITIVLLPTSLCTLASRLITLLKQSSHTYMLLACNLQMEVRLALKDEADRSKALVFRNSETKHKGEVLGFRLGRGGRGADVHLWSKVGRAPHSG